MRFSVLGSGSRGNATLIECRGTRILLDCGFALRETERRLRQIEVAADSIAAIVITHEHADHVAGVTRLAAKYGLEVWCSPGTWKGIWKGIGSKGNGHAGRIGGGAEYGCAARPLQLRLFSSHGRGFRIGELMLRPIPVPHDAREPCQFVIEGAGRRLGVLTDAGTVTARMCDALKECDSLMLEANHDSQMLRDGPYPRSLQQRVGGPFGHLSNLQAAELLAAVHHRHLKRVLLSHLSAQNNHPALALAAVRSVDADLSASLLVAEQDQCSGWFEV
jgi:phosphoribosyl 1,2-cyclic phosphodiesterase